MKNFKYLTIQLVPIFLLLFYSNLGHSQIARCKGSVTVSTDAWSCSYTLLPSDINDGSSDYDNLTVDKSVLTVLGSSIVTLTASKTNGQSSTCTCNVTLADKTAPVAVIAQGLTITLNDQNRFNLTPEIVDQGSYDNCSSVTLAVSPSLIDCSTPNPVLVTMTVTDAFGNSNQTWTYVNIDQNKNRQKSLACNDHITFGVTDFGSYEVTADSLLEGGPYGCSAFYQVVLSYNNVPRPTPVVSIADVGKTFVYAVTDPETNNTCWGNITILKLECSNSFVVCDTKSSCEPLSDDCSSGHSLTDDIEWPCDITISNASTSLLINPSLTKIASFLNVPVADIKPVLFDGMSVNNKCLNISESIQTEALPLQKKIKVMYSYANWTDTITGPYTYTQYFTLDLLDNSACDVCDTLPWNAPVGDCASGHTLNDAVEWPADITVDFLDVSPYNLSQHSSVDSNNVAPRLNSACSNNWVLTYGDSSIQIDSNHYQIIRTWMLSNPGIHFYNQTITINAPTSNERSVCFNTMNATPISDVKIGNNTFSSIGGCTKLAYNAGDTQIKPTKADSDFQSGLDIEDLIMLKENIFGLRPFNELENTNGDMNNDGQLNSKDANILTDLLTDKSSTNANFISPWWFVDANEYYYKNKVNNFADLSSPFAKYDFIGMKIGDLNNNINSTMSLLKASTFTLDDQVLNDGQAYIVKVFTKDALRFKGFQLAVAKNDAFSIVDAIGMGSKIQVIDQGNQYLLLAVADDQYIRGNGITTDSKESIFEINIRANKNVVLHDIFELSSKDNLLVEGYEKDNTDIKLSYNGTIPTSTVAFINNRIAIYPNPTNGVLSIESTEDQILNVDIHNTNGQIMKSMQGNELKSVDVSNLPNGFYTLHLSISDGSYIVKKMIKI